MAEREPIITPEGGPKGGKFYELLAQLQRMLAEGDKGSAKRGKKLEQVKKAAGEKKFAREETRSAKEWAKRAKSGDPLQQEHARLEAQAQRYTVVRSVEQGRLMLDEVRGSGAAVPDWIGADGFQHSAAAMEFATRIALLPPELQNNPDILYREQARLYQSIEWSSKDAAAEGRELLERISAKIKEVGVGNPEYDGVSERDLLQNIRDPEDIYRVLRPPKPDAGPEPVEPQKPRPGKRLEGEEWEQWKADHKDELDSFPARHDAWRAEHDAWEKRRPYEEQWEKLNDLLDRYQRQLDSEQYAGITTQQNTLRELHTELGRGIGDTRYNKALESKIARYDPSTAEFYQRRVQERLNNINAQIERERTMQQRGSREWVTWSEVKHLARVYDERTGELVQLNMDRDDDEVHMFRALFSTDVEKMMQDPDGMRRWFYEFTDEIYGLGKEHVRPSLNQETRYEDLLNLMKWIYGDQANFYIGPYIKLWNDRSRLEYVMKGLLYQPGDMKEKTKIMRQFLGSDMDYLYKFEHANKASSLMEQVIFETLAERRAKFEETMTHLQGEITVPAGLSRAGSRMNRAQYYRYLEEQNAKGFPGMRPEDVTRFQAEMLQLKGEVELVAGGVMLWDEDMQSYTELGFQLQDLVVKRDRLAAEKQDARGDFSPAQEEELLRLTGEINRLRAVYSKSEETYRGMGISEEMTLFRGYSPIEIEVHKRLAQYLKQNNQEVPDYILRHAIWAARLTNVGTGRAMAIAANMAIRPAEDLIEVFGTPDASEYVGKYFRGLAVMRSPFAEDIIRTFRPELFHYRFSMGGPMGERALAILQINRLLAKTKIGKEKITSTEEFQRVMSTSHDPQIQQLRALMEIAEKDHGIDFRELLTGPLTGAGGYYDGSGWRLEGGALVEFNQLYVDLVNQGMVPEGGQLDNQALGLQLMASQSPEARYRIFTKMLERKTSNFFQLLGKDRDRIIKEAGLIDPETGGIDEKKWQAFRRALSLAEIEWSQGKDKTLRFRQVDFTDIDMSHENGFAQVVKYLDPETSPEDIEKYRNVMAGIRRHLTEGDTNTDTRLWKLSQNNLHMTLPLTDFDWAEASFFKLGSTAMDRRGRDIFNQSEAMGIMLELLSNPQFLSPQDYVKTLEQIMTLRKTITNYATTGVAENAAKEMLRMFIDFNRNRAFHGKGAAKIMGWMPGGDWIMRNLAEQDFRGLANSRLLNGITGGAWKHMAEHSIVEWPHSIADAWSYSIRFTGSHGNAYGEKTIAEIIATAEDMGMFTDNRNFAHDLRKEFHATLFWRHFQTLRRYWWVVPVATIALAVSQAVKEEEKESKGH